MSAPSAIRAALRRGFRHLAWRRGAVPIIPATRIGGPVPWLVAIMVALVMVGAGGALAMHGLTRAATAELARSATVQIVEADPADSARQAAAAAVRLRGAAGVESVREVPREELAALLEPWLGEGVLDGELIPVPALIDLRLAGPADTAALRRLTDKIAEVAPAARIEAQSAALAPLFAAISSVRYLALSVSVLLGTVGITAVWLAVRNALANNADTVEVVHLLGGDDRQIAGVFQRAVLPDAAAGAVIGAGLGAGALWLLGRQFAALDGGFGTGGGLGTAEWALLLLVPLLAVAAALLTARLTILGSLRRSL